MAVAAWAWRTLAVSEPFVQCIQQRNNYPEYGQLHERSVSLGFLLAWADLRSACAVHIANKYNGPIAAVSSLAVAGFTFILWWSTEKLWKAADQERKAAEASRAADARSRAEDIAHLQKTLAVANQHALAADKGAQASAKLAGTADLTARQQLRAYVLIDSVSVTNVVVGGKAKAEIKIRNYGQTPAYSIKQWSAMGFDYFPLSTEIPLPNDAIRGSGIVGPNGVLSTIGDLDRPLTPHEIDGLSAGRVAIYATGRISYRDIFGEERITEYLLFTGGPIGNVTRMAPYVTGNQAT